MVRAMQDPRATTYVASNHGWGLPGVPSQISIEVGTSHVLGIVVGVPGNGIDDKKAGLPFLGACYVLSQFNHVQFLETLWTIALQAPLSMGFSRQEYWSGLPLPPSGDLPDPGIKPCISCISCIGRQVLYP